MNIMLAFGKLMNQYIYPAAELASTSNFPRHLFTVVSLFLRNIVWSLLSQAQQAFKL